MAAARAHHGCAPIADGATVADIGAGGGWFTIRPRARVGPNGVVYAEDIQPQMIESIRRRVKAIGLTNVQPMLGTATDPQLPTGLHAVLMVDTYPQIADPVASCATIAKALAPNGQARHRRFQDGWRGRTGTATRGAGQPGGDRQRGGSGGPALRSEETFLRYQYLLVFGK